MHWLKHVNFSGIIAGIFLSICATVISVPAFCQESVLSSGKWCKIAITQTGVHKIDVNLLDKMGFDVSSLVPAQIKIYGNGGKMLPQKNASDKAKDLIENAILVRGEEDGKFDGNDAIYFYAEGPHVINYDSVKQELRHQLNFYTDTSYYFLTVGNSSGLRIKGETSITSPTGKVVNEFTDYWFHEQESVNTLRSGRFWWGEYLGGSAGISIQIDMPGVVPSSSIKFLSSAMGSAQVSTRFLWQLNGQTVGESAVGAVGSGTYDIKGQLVENDFITTAGLSPPSSFSVGVTYDKKGQSSAQAYLNYIGLQLKRQLRVYNNQQTFNFFPETRDTVTYQIQNIQPDWILWNISDPLHPFSLAINNTGRYTGRNGKVMRRFIGFMPDQAFIPSFWQQIANQNIAKSNVPDLLIITPPLWESEARRLAAFREEHDGFETLVITTAQVYNEYASGKPDLSALRNFTRDLYLRNPEKLKYLLLFGDATYDYKNNLQNQSQSQRNGWVPVYESRESLNPVYTYSSDDYYGFMEEQEGEWTESYAGDHTVDLGMGRLPVKSLSEARTIVNKLTNYSTSGPGMGNWRNTISFVADDGDGNVHQEHADQLAKLVNPDFLPERIFLDAFPQTTTSEGQKVPAVNAAINKSISGGTLILNYTGHGGVSGWAEEQVLTLSDMLSARGYNNLPLLFTATCDFGRYDDPGLVSGAEIMVLSPKGAAIGAVSTTRPVYSSTNFTLSKAFYEALVKAGPKTRMGDIFSVTKNNALVGALNRNFTLLGDPSMKLVTVEKKVRWVQKPDTLRALQRIDLDMEIYNQENATTDQAFEGTARVVVYDKQSPFKTLGNEGNVQSYSEFRSKLFDGNVSVRNGKIHCQFIMPKDIDYRAGMGRVSVYAVRADSLTDAGGQLDVTVGGSVALIPDKTPPELTAYLNDPSFKDGDFVENSPVLIIKVSDENGINLSNTGIGHDITLSLNDTLQIVLNDYYTANLDDYRSGTIRYPFENLPSGNYTIRIKVWDIYTNYSEIAFGFQVGLVRGIKLTDLKIYPNPFSDELSFEINHSRVNEDIEVVFHLLLDSGQQVGFFSWQYYNSESVIRESVASTPLVKLIAPNILYIYTIEIKSLKDNSIDKRSGRIIRSP